MGIPRAGVGYQERLRRRPSGPAGSVATPSQRRMVPKKQSLVSTPLRSALLGLALAWAGCGGGASEPAAAGGIDRELFIATYVDLRATTIRSDSFAISDTDRAAVLARHGVTEQQLLEFPELHGRDVEFMRTVWDEVERRLDAERLLPEGNEPTTALPDRSSDPARSDRARPR